MHGRCQQHPVGGIGCANLREATTMRKRIVLVVVLVAVTVATGALWVHARRVGRERKYEEATREGDRASLAYEYSDASNWYRQAAELQPGRADIWEDVGVSAHYAGDLAQAESALLTANALEPGRPWVHSHLAGIYRHQGRFAQALAETEAELKITPAKPRTHVHYVVALNQVGRLQTAYDTYEARLLDDPNDALGHFGLGMALTFDGEYERALMEFHEAADIDDGMTEARRQMARALLFLDLPQKAEIELRRVRAEDPKAYADTLLGWALLDQGRYGEAEAVYRQAIRERPVLAAAHSGLARVCGETGRIDESLREYREAIKWGST